ncbi:DUF7694 domain-containing protein [Alistipes putredinis]|uniref:DUF7694 domain-containing protein n=1 Tax=Alistipes putredinis TaxID=28117 RepID=UPI0024319360|nr:hypothetical protein [Alistipes putredinis]
MTEKELERFRANVTLPFDIPRITASDKYGHYSTGVYSYKGMFVIIAIEDGKWHLSVSAKQPLGYYQLKEIRYEFLPNDIHMAQIFPPREEFVNVHQNCFHLWEI